MSRELELLYAANEFRAARREAKKRMADLRATPVGSTEREARMEEYRTAAKRANDEQGQLLRIALDERL